ncbi:HSBP1 protein, partial [Chauna torquata]|nr:HSBP1 protein [Chauna torquata]
AEPPSLTMAETDPKTVQDLTAVIAIIFLNSNELDDMSCRIDDLEKNIADLMTQAGVEELEGENKTPATNKS